MEKEAVGTVIGVAKQWWLKINTKPLRTHALDGAVFPYVIKVEYVVNGKKYTKRKWVGVGKKIPDVGSTVAIVYSENKPSKAIIKL